MGSARAPGRRLTKCQPGPDCRDTGIDPDAPGLYFVGYALPLTGQLPEVAGMARRVGKVAATRVRAFNRAMRIGVADPAPAVRQLSS